MEKIKQGDEQSQSKDLVQDNIEKLKALFPEIVTEGKIDFKVLQEVLGEELEEGEEYYRFTWAGKAQARREANKPSTGTLRPAKDESVDWDTTQNLYLEGDNLEVLKLLQKSYANKVKMIYIDPPYNTGKDFVYKDNYKDNLRNYQEITGQIDSKGNKMSTNSDSDGRYHSNWLNMMYPRLRLASNLLKEDGVLFISIDDNEVENLIKVCKELFGEECLKLIAVKMSESSGLKMTSVKRNGTIPKLKEYILVVKKDGVKNVFIKPIPKEKWDTEYNIYIEGLTREIKNEINRIQEHETVDIKDIEKLDNLISNLSLKSVNELLKEEPVLDKKKWYFDNAWRICRTTASSSVLKLANEKRKNSSNKLFFVLSVTGLVYFVKGDYDLQSKKPRLQIIFADDNLTYHPGDFWSHIKTTGLDNEGGVPYKNGKKPLKLLQGIFESIPDVNNDIILDFFSGSASSAESILRLNASDGKKRRFIMVQLPENLDSSLIEAGSLDLKKSLKESIEFLKGKKLKHFLTELGKERIRISAKKIAQENPEKAKTLDLGFKVFKLDSSNIQSWSGNPDNLEKELFDAVDNIKTDRSEEDVLYEILLKYGLDLTLPIEEKEIAGKTVFNVGMGAIFICLASGITTAVAEGIGKWKVELDPSVCRVIFKDAGFQGKKPDEAKTNAIQTLKRFGISDIKSI